MPSAHPEVNKGLRYYSRWKRFGEVPNGEKMKQAIEVLDDEFRQLEIVQAERNK